MPIDMNRIVEAAVQAAVQEATRGAREHPRSRKPRIGRAVILGAAVVTGARLLAGDRGRQLMASLQERLEALEGDEEPDDAGADEDAEEAA